MKTLHDDAACPSMVQMASTIIFVTASTAFQTGKQVRSTKQLHVTETTEGKHIRQRRDCGRVGFNQGRSKILLDLTEGKVVKVKKSRVICILLGDRSLSNIDFAIQLLLIIPTEILMQLFDLLLFCNYNTKIQSPFDIRR